MAVFFDRKICVQLFLNGIGAWAIFLPIFEWSWKLYLRKISWFMREQLLLSWPDTFDIFYVISFVFRSETITKLVLSILRQYLSWRCFGDFSHDTNARISRINAIFDITFWRLRFLGIWNCFNTPHCVPTGSILKQKRFTGWQITERNRATVIVAGSGMSNSRMLGITVPVN